MGEIQSFRDLEAWQRAMDLSVLVYSLSNKLPLDERFGLTSQVRRASVSVPSNIAEGHSCGEDGRYIHHLHVAAGSLGELSTQFELAVRLRFLKEAEVEKLQQQIGRTRQIVHGLLRSLKRRRLAQASGGTRAPDLNGREHR